MTETRALYHRTKETNIYPVEGDLFRIEAILQDEIHDVIAEVDIEHPSLEIVAARAAIRNGPFTNVCNLAAPNVEKLVGLKVGRGFTREARARVGGSGGCHRVSELVVEIAQAAYQLHFVRFFGDAPAEVREREDVPTERREAVLEAVPGMRDTCFSYSTANDDRIPEADPMKIRRQDLPTRAVSPLSGSPSRRSTVSERS